jgi:uncharacterized RDD family membrane protein YckC
MSPITVLNKSNVPTGPFSRQVIAQKLQNGEIALTDLAFVDGLAAWTPLREVLAKVDGAAAPVVAPISVPPAASPAYSYAATMAPPTHLVYAGFWLRVVAYLIDSVILNVVFFVAVAILAVLASIVIAVFGGGLHSAGTTNWLTSGSGNGEGAAPNSLLVVLGVIGELVIGVGALIGAWLYFAKLESGPQQSTYGKRVMGLRVTDLTGQRISFGRASGRFFGKIISGMTFYIGFIMAGVTQRKQALHDMMADTLVVRN